MVRTANRRLQDYAAPFQGQTEVQLLVLVDDHRLVAEDILDRMQGRTSASLATQEAFHRAMEHCTSDNESATEHARSKRGA